MPAEIAQDPEVVRRATGLVWPADKPFPLTPLDAWYVMRGWWIAPAAGVTMEQIIEELPGKLEGGGSWLSSGADDRTLETGPAERCGGHLGAAYARLSRGKDISATRLL